MRLTVEHYKRTITITEPHEDADIGEWIQCFVAAMVGITFHQDTVHQGMDDYLEERGYYDTDDNIKVTKEDE